MYLDVKLEIYYALLASNLRKRIEEFLYESLKADMIIIKSHKYDCGFHHYRMFIREEAVKAKWLEALEYLINTHDNCSHCIVHKKKIRKRKNPFTKL